MGLLTIYHVFKNMHLPVLLHSLSPAVPILERKGYAFDFPEKEKKGQKRANYLKIWAKIDKI